MVPTSAQWKLARGIEHVQTLRGEAYAFEHREAYRFRVERQPRTPYHVEYDCFAIEREPPPDHWPLLAGEAIQNLRSALDHVVYAAAPKRRRSRTQFPIFDDVCEFQVKGLPRIQGVPAAMRTTIEQAQPYHLPQRRRHALAMLRDLSNLDKHRTLAVIAAAVWREHVGMREDIETNWTKIATERPLGHGETHISAFTATSKTEITEMDVHPGFAYQVGMEGRSLDILVMIAKKVFEVVTECETSKPVPPFARYPI